VHVFSDMPTLAVYTHRDCLKHRVMFHPESPERLRYLLEDVVPPLSKELGFEIHEPDRIPKREELIRVHSPSYVDSISNAFAEVENGQVESVYLDADTQVVPGTKDTSLRAVGVTLQAVEDVINGRALRAFVMVRPPGHHAEPQTAMGFCYYNNVMIGLAHAQAIYPDVIRRVALLDFDVHHGNGGQANCFDDPSRFFASTHQSPLFPWKGLVSDKGVDLNVLNVPLSKDSTREDFCQAWDTQIIPAVKDFNPDMIFVSAGFDGHSDDPLASLCLEEEDFGHVTSKIADLANEVSGGRIVTVLEGGYDPDALGRCVTSHLKALATAPLPSKEQRKPKPEVVNQRRPNTLFSEDEINNMDKSTLRSELSKLDLPTSGKLEALRERLGRVPIS